MARARRRAIRTLLVLGLTAMMTASAQATTVTLVNLDGAGEGFNDTTPRAPEGGNPGVTLGALRQNAFNEAADRWEAILSSSVTIEVDAAFNDLAPCGPGGAVLGSAGPNSFHRDYAGAPVASTWFSQAEANSHNGSDLSPSVSDLTATFNSDLDNGCLPGITGWYYGFDGDPPPGTVDFVPTLLHEMAHGLGFLSGVSLATGAKLAGLDDTYMRFLEDHSTGLLYSSMTNGERVTASTNTGNLHWTGANVIAASGLLSAGKTGTHVHMYAPSPQEPGSSVSHFSTALSPDELMEPFDTGTNFQALTNVLMKDIGWTLLTTPTPTPTFTPSPTFTPPPTITPSPTASPTATLPTCASGPIAGCRTPAVGGKASVQYKDVVGNDTKDQLQWKWSRGSVTTKAEFGNPLATTSYQLCVYDGASTLIFDSTIPAGGLCGVSNPKPCWKDKPKGFDYRDKDLTPDGISQMKLQEGLVAGKAQIQVRGKGVGLDDPPLPFGQPVTVQLHNAESGLCWETIHSSPASKNVAGPPTGQFKDKAD